MLHCALAPLLTATRLGRPLLWRVLASLLLATWATGCAGLPPPGPRTPSRAFDAPDQTTLGRLVQARKREVGSRADSGFMLLDSVDAAYASRVALVDGAERSLDLQYYAIHADASTEVLLQRLRDAARRGVRIRILLDDFNTAGDDAQVLRLAFEPGIEMRLFNPLPGPRGSLVGRVLGSLHDVQRIQKRMHNKLFLADNAWGITGGRNLGDAYFGSGDKSNFVDLDVLAAGRVVRDMSASFDRYWNDELAYPVQALLTPEDLARLREAAPAVSEPPGGVLPVGAPAPDQVLPQVAPAQVAAAERPALDLARVPLVWAPAVLMVDKPDKVGPGDDEVDAGETVIDGLLSLMRQARREVLIISPYFVPGAEMMGVFAQLRQQGIAVRVLTNSLASNDAPAAHAGYRRYREDLLALGVQLHEMRADLQGTDADVGWGLGSGAGSKSASSRASLHSKAVVIDRRLSVIGSMNLDLRSQLQNSEVALVIRSPRLAAQSVRQIEHTLATAAYRVELANGGLRWRAPPGAAFGDVSSEPGAGWRRRLLVNLIAPFAPDEML